MTSATPDKESSLWSAVLLFSVTYLACLPPGGERSDAKGGGDTWAVGYTDALRYA